MRAVLSVNGIPRFPRPAGGRIVVAGDWHGDTAWAMHVIEQAAALGMDTILHVGDLGVLGPGDVGSSFTFKLQGQLDKHGRRAASQVRP